MWMVKVFRLCEWIEENGEWKVVWSISSMVSNLSLSCFPFPVWGRVKAREDYGVHLVLFDLYSLNLLCI